MKKSFIVILIFMMVVLSALAFNMPADSLADSVDVISAVDTSEIHSEVIIMDQAIFVQPNMALHFNLTEKQNDYLVSLHGFMISPDPDYNYVDGNDLAYHLLL